MTCALVVAQALGQHGHLGGLDGFDKDLILAITRNGGETLGPDW